MWKTILAWLASLAADPAAHDLEAPRAAAAVAAAYAAQATDAKPRPDPAPEPGKCCQECGGKGYIVQPDGHRTACPCPTTCMCKAASTPAGTPCRDGRCPAPGASPALISPAKPAGGR